MENEKIYSMSYANIYDLLLAKALQKDRTKNEVDEVISWLTGYSQAELDSLHETGLTYGDFFKNAPSLNPARKLIKGSVCGVKLESITEPLMLEIRYLDKLIDELAKGKPLEKIFRK